jgi:hypothetical protein
LFAFAAAYSACIELAELSDDSGAAEVAAVLDGTLEVPALGLVAVVGVVVAVVAPLPQAVAISASAAIPTEYFTLLYLRIITSPWFGKCVSLRRRVVRRRG